MRLFDDDKVGCYLDDIGHRIEKTKDGKEIAMVDLTLRVQPFTAELATSLDPDVRALLFRMNDGEPKDKIKSIHFALTIPNQNIAIYLVPDGQGPIADQFLAERLIPDVEISGLRARKEKGVDGFGLVFYASFGPVGKDELEYIVAWYTQQRFVTFHPQEPVLDFSSAAPSENVVPAVLPPRPRRVQQGVSA